MSDTIRSSPPTATTVPAKPATTTDTQQAEDYRRGREEGTTWARDFATVDELRDFVASFDPSQNDDFSTLYWQGFLAAAQEVVDSFSRGSGAQ